MEETNTRCSICLSDIENQTKNNQCNHIYCFDCIFNWVKSNDSCPLCKVKIKELINNDNEIIKVEEPKKPAPENVEADISCLDNKFFLEEVEKLLSISHSIVLQMEGLMTSHKKVYVTPTMTTEDTNRLNQITDRLYILQKDLENYENAFDPEDLLSTLYIYETTLTDLKNIYLSEFLNNNNLNGNNYSNRNRNKYKQNHTTSGDIRGGYTNYNDDDYESDEYEDEDYYEIQDQIYNKSNNNSGGGNGNVSRNSKLNNSNNNNLNFNNNNNNNNNNNDKPTPSKR
ncbi:hypothetical protein DDB_G0280987 [Dictyostelium discoideum AX4]|uniref:RING-type domain-containing protein n=1 Tax=Dictyostelium discoideum TaxID=44689 RepID=Q54UM2_DICDI|nr:hypothetical protein DDB_G0280987 [Dictyostelium discoideum AX4]EAL66790.1 hypothetical protein DDB_G0280987 [Dictyostelium discoideum AX4]|eukprot:XP_640754.1 hypothetical protein DDB_G0280987 [Dictyostelium discoideum AX4]